MQPSKSDKLDFLYSPSFWSMFIASVALMLGPDGVPTMQEIYQGLLALSTGFTAIYTLNKNVKKIAESNKPTIPMIDGEV